VEDYRSNLTQIIALLRKSFPSAKLLLLTPTIFSKSAWEAEMIRRGEAPGKKDRSSENQKVFVDACLEIGLKEGVVCVDQDKAMKDALEAGVTVEEVLSDGLHLTSKGYSVSEKRRMMGVCLDWDGSLYHCEKKDPLSSYPSCNRCEFPGTHP
jgi:lysophospholipase L1-like esterase